MFIKIEHVKYFFFICLFKVHEDLEFCHLDGGLASQICLVMSNNYSIDRYFSVHCHYMHSHLKAFSWLKRGHKMTGGSF